MATTERVEPEIPAPTTHSSRPLWAAAGPGSRCMSTQQDSFQEGSDRYLPGSLSSGCEDRERLKLKQKSVRELLTALVRLADATRSARASASVVEWDFAGARSHERRIVGELRRRRSVLRASRASGGAGTMRKM